MAARAPYQVFLNIYDVQANDGNDNISAMITRINKFGRDLGIGGVFHGAVQIDKYEWSFGWCEKGSGVYVVEAQRNPLYQFRETVDLGPTLKSKQEIKAILHALKQEWQGISYELLSKNCCHFCEAFVTELAVKPIPGWVNRFATSADATVAFTQDAMTVARNMSNSIRTTAASSVSWLRESVGRMTLRTSLSGAAPPLPASSQTSSSAASATAPQPALLLLPTPLQSAHSASAAGSQQQRSQRVEVRVLQSLPTECGLTSTSAPGSVTTGSWAHTASRGAHAELLSNSNGRTANHASLPPLPQSSSIGAALPGTSRFAGMALPALAPGSTAASITAGALVHSASSPASSFATGRLMVRSASAQGTAGVHTSASQGGGQHGTQQHNYLDDDPQGTLLVHDCEAAGDDSPYAVYLSSGESNAAAREGSATAAGGGAGGENRLMRLTARVTDSGRLGNAGADAAGAGGAGGGAAGGGGAWAQCDGTDGNVIVGDGLGQSAPVAWDSVGWGTVQSDACSTPGSVIYNSNNNNNVSTQAGTQHHLLDSMHSTHSAGQHSAQGADSAGRAADEATVRAGAAVDAGRSLNACAGAAAAVPDLIEL